ncbi:hypothetical protein MKX07_002813 [Trichoderma sp. CBMAI-0711]|nr:hypothetical protein MKX07_002813 [Trichoderma sp. CBMAI-0711]
MHVIADLLKDIRPASMSEHPDDRMYHIKDMLLEKTDANQDSEAWMDFAGKQKGRTENVIVTAFDAMYGVDLSESSNADVV